MLKYHLESLAKKIPKGRAGKSMSGMVVFRVSCSDNPRNFHERLGVLRIMGSQNWWFGDPRPLLYTSKPLHSRIQWFFGLPFLVKQHPYSMLFFALHHRPGGQPPKKKRAVLRPAFAYFALQWRSILTLIGVIVFKFYLLTGKIFGCQKNNCKCLVNKTFSVAGGKMEICQLMQAFFDERIK